MPSHLDQLESTALAGISSAKSLKQLEEVELLFLGRKQGELTNFMKTLKDMSPEERKQVGEAANAVKEKIEGIKIPGFDLKDFKLELDL